MIPKNENLAALSRSQLYELIELYAKNWLALDGVWFQSIEEKNGMDEAMAHDLAAWARFTRIEARRIKAFLRLPEYAGLEGLKQALGYRFYASLNEDTCYIEGNTLTYRTLACRVQRARAGKGMPYHPCRPVGLVEYTGFAQVIDTRLRCECLSCYPEVRDESCACAWRFTLVTDDTPASGDRTAADKAAANDLREK